MALDNNVSLELNCASIDEGLYREEFWKTVKTKVICGLDAHSIRETEARFNGQPEQWKRMKI